jgi:uracil-DNA glycosylase
MRLRAALEEFLQGWKDDLSPAWREVLETIEPDFGAVRADLQFRSDEVIYPGRRRQPIASAPAGAHFLRAFDRLRPEGVKAVLLGQDPFPDVAIATGRSFEPGVMAWPEDPGRLPPTFRRIAQALVTARTGSAEYGKSDAGWHRVVGDIASGKLDLALPRQLFDTLEDRGVLFLNSSLTISRFEPEGGPEQVFGHIPLWRPVTHRVVQFLAARPAGHAVYILLGAKAHEVFEQAAILRTAEQAGAWKTRVDVTVHPHPNIPPGSSAFSEGPNPFVRTNELLTAMGAAPIAW